MAEIFPPRPTRCAKNLRRSHEFFRLNHPIPLVRMGKPFRRLSRQTPLELEPAARTGRTAGNLSRTLRTMERYGLVRLHKGARGMVRPEVPYRDVQLEMTLS